ncbi:hypothetical protein [Haloarchaeobius sp. HRN-SO-5]|uniref:hypothetical protein n=1 Tax=Haloarchaeobius sp. HRN-SO-5 TaxID=3446118 RepID=UPI003EBA82AC
MLDQLTAACEGCDQLLDADQLMLTMSTAGGVRRAYECDCGAVTVTVVRED